MKYYELELNGRTVKFRLTSGDCMAIEKSSGKAITNFVGELSMSSIITLLRYMVRSSQSNFNQEDASALYDELVDAGYTLETIINDIIMEALAVSGFMSKADLNKIRDVKEEIKEKASK